MPSFDWFVYRGGVISRLFTPFLCTDLDFTMRRRDAVR